MVLLDHLWDDVVASNISRKSPPLSPCTPNMEERAAASMQDLCRCQPATPVIPVTPGTPTAPSPTAARRDNVWRSVFHPGSNLATKTVGADYFDRPQPNSPTAYDWLYRGDTRNKYR